MSEMDSGQELSLQEKEIKHLVNWQNKLLGWLIFMPTALVFVFIFLATLQLQHFNSALSVKPDTVLMNKISVVPGSEAQPEMMSLSRMQWMTLTYLEQESFYRRYNQGGMLLLSRIFTKYLAFFTGMILAIVGSVFIIGKIREQSSTIGSSYKDFKLDVKSSSPGIIFGILGTALMLAAVFQHADVSIEDRPMYLNSNAILATQLFNAQSAGDTSQMNADLLKNMMNIYANPDTVQKQKETR